MDHAGFQYKAIRFFITLLLIMILLLCSFQPYKKQFYNVLDTFFLASAVLFMSSFWIMQDFTTRLVESADRVILLSIPVVYPCTVCCAVLCVEEVKETPVSH